MSLSKKLAIFAVIVGLFCGIADGRNRNLPPEERGMIAVYVTGDDIPQNILSALNIKILHNLVKSGRYVGIERHAPFLSAIEDEHSYQRSGHVSDAEIRRLGQQHGLQYICVGNITPALNQYIVTARIIDVETARVVATGSTQSYLGNLSALTRASDNIVRSMLGTGRQRRERIHGTWTMIAGAAITVAGIVLENNYVMLGGGLTFLVGGGQALVYVRWEPDEDKKPALSSRHYQDIQVTPTPPITSMQNGSGARQDAVETRAPRPTQPQSVQGRPGIIGPMARIQEEPKENSRILFSTWRRRAVIFTNRDYHPYDEWRHVTYTDPDGNVISGYVHRTDIRE